MLAEELPDGAFTVGYPVYGERVERARDVLVEVGAVTPGVPLDGTAPTCRAR